MNWKTLEHLDMVSLIGEMSYAKKQAIFKHSTRCATSSMILNRLEREWNIPEEEMDVYFLDLIAHREISDDIADRWQVKHESPQLLIIENDSVVYHDSHTAISFNAIKELV